MNRFRLVLCRGLRCGVLIAVLRTSLPAQKATSTTALSADSVSLMLPGTLALTATANQTPASGVPSGKVAFTYDKGIPLGVATLQTLPSTQTFPSSPTASIGYNYAQSVAITAVNFSQNTGPSLVVANNSSGPAVIVLPNLGQGKFGGSGAISTGTLLLGSVDQVAKGFFLDPSKESALIHFTSNLYQVTDGSNFIVGSPAGASSPDVEVLSIDDFDGDGYSDVGVLIQGNATYQLPARAGIAMNQGAVGPAGFFNNFAEATLPTLAPDGTSQNFCIDSVATGKFIASLNAQLAVLGHFGNCFQSIPNTPSYILFYAAPPTFSPASGTASAQDITVSISSVLPGATIYYTTDGSIPTTQSAIYSGPITVPPVPNGTRVNAIAVLPNGTVQTVLGSAEYLLQGPAILSHPSSSLHSKSSSAAFDRASRLASSSRAGSQMSLPRASTLATTLFQVGSGHTSVAAADFNQDKNLDLVLGGSTQNQGSTTQNQIQIFYGDGTGAFQAATTVSQTSSVPLKLAVGDFNGDGAPDLATTLSGGGIEIFLNTGTGFQPAATQPYPTGPVTDICTGDFNSDGLADLALLIPPPTSGNDLIQTFLSSASAQAVFNTPSKSLPSGTHTLTAVYSGDNNFGASTSNAVSEVVTQTPTTLTWAAPPDIVLTVTPPIPLPPTVLNAAATAGGAAISGTYTYTCGGSPAAGCELQLGNTQLGVVFTPDDSFDYASATDSVVQNVKLPLLSATFNINSGGNSGGQQPSINLNLDPFPLNVGVTITLSFTDATSNPAASNGTVKFMETPQGDTLTAPNVDNFTINAKSSSPQPARIFNVGTVAGTVTVTVELTYNGTVSSLTPVPIIVPATVPTAIDGATYTVSGSTLSVAVTASSTTREISAADFQFTPASGQSLKTTDINLTGTNLQDFQQWFAGPNSPSNGGSFTYTQTFTVSPDADAVGGVTITLTNGQGQSAPIVAVKSD